MRTIGVISDTHGLLRQEALDALVGSDLILHAGDVGEADILERLAEIAPVRAVRGNTDYGSLGASLPDTDVVDLGAPLGGLSESAVGPVAYLLHVRELLDLDPVAAGFSVVIFGHTHSPEVDRRGDVLFFNPGAAGHRRFDLPITVGRLHVDGDAVRPEILELDV